MNNISITTARPYTGVNDLGAADAVRETAVRHSEDHNLNITEGAFQVPGEIGEDVDPAIEASLVRDDALGILISRSFDLPAPPMPAFACEWR